MDAKIIVLLVVGFLGWVYKVIRPPPPKICGSPNGPSVTSTRIRLRDGRHLAYLESGVPKEMAKYKIVLVHGFGGTKEFSLPASQMILCSTVKLFRQAKKDTTIGELNKSYTDICKSTLLPPANMLELSNMCRVLTDQGLLKLGQSRVDKLKRVTLQVDEADITFALQGIRLFRNCLQMNLSCPS